MLADVVKNGTTKQVVRVTSPHLELMQVPNVTTAGTVEKYIYDNFTATVTGISAQAET